MYGQPGEHDGYQVFSTPADHLETSCMVFPSVASRFRVRRACLVTRDAQRLTG